MEKMKRRMKGIRSAVVMGLSWAVGWTSAWMLCVVVFYTLFPDVPDVFDIWIPVFAYPGFFGGVIFSVIHKYADGGRRIEEMPLPRIAVRGVVVGLLLGVMPFVLGTPTARFPLWLTASVIISYTTIMSTVSAVVTGLVLRWFARRGN